MICPAGKEYALFKERKLRYNKTNKKERELLYAL